MIEHITGDEIMDWSKISIVFGVAGLLVSVLFGLYQLGGGRQHRNVAIVFGALCLVVVESIYLIVPPTNSSKNAIEEFKRQNEEEWKKFWMEDRHPIHSVADASPCDPIAPVHKRKSTSSLTQVMLKHSASPTPPDDEVKAKITTQSLPPATAAQNNQDEEQAAIDSAHNKAEQEHPQKLYRPRGGVTAPMLLSKVAPEYSAEARAAKYQGMVVLYIEISPDGKPHNLKVLRSLGLGLDEKAMEAVNQWRFRPGSRDGQSVNTQATVEIGFSLRSAM